MSFLARTGCSSTSWGGGYRPSAVPAESMEWALETKVQMMQGFDIGVMPMPNNEWTKGKLGIKMLLYMALGVPAVVSYSETNADVIQDGINGFLVRNQHEWTQKLEALIRDPALRRRIGLAGRKTAEERFSLEVSVPKLFEIIDRLAR